MTEETNAHPTRRERANTSGAKRVEVLHKYADALADAAHQANTLGFREEAFQLATRQVEVRNLACVLGERLACGEAADGAAAQAGDESAAQAEVSGARAI